MPEGRGEWEFTGLGGEDDDVPKGGGGLFENMLDSELEDSELGGLLTGLSEKLLLLLPLPHVEMTVGTLTNAETSEDRLELRMQITSHCFTRLSCSSNRCMTNPIADMALSAAIAEHSGNLHDTNAVRCCSTC